jgi:hypothetical protein
VPSIVIYSLVLMVCVQVSQKLANLATNGSFIPRFGIFHLNSQSRHKPHTGQADRVTTRPTLAADSYDGGTQQPTAGLARPAAAALG